MKYTPSTESIPQSSRRAVNEKLLYLIDNNCCEAYGITKQDVFQGYTGDGGLHGLSRKNYRSYHTYSEAKKELENGQFFTPPALCQFVADCLRLEEDDLVADKTTPRLIQFHTLKNAVNPPFLGGFSIFNTVVA